MTLKMPFCVSLLQATLAVSSFAFTGVRSHGEPLAGFQVETDRADALYRIGEMAAFTVTATNAPDVKATSGRCRVVVDNYGGKPLHEEVIDLVATNPFTVKGCLDEPGFLRLRIFGSDCREVCRWSVGYEPERIRKGSETPPDFDCYWQNEIVRLEREVPLDAQIERVGAYCTPDFDYLKISFATFGRRVYGVMSVPRDGTRECFPVDIEVSAAGFGAHSNDMAGKKEVINVFFGVYPFEVDKRWKELGLEDKYNAFNDSVKAKYGFGYYPYAGSNVSREEFFYHAVILGLNRAINWIVAQPNVDRTQVRYHGTSQGGGLGVILCGLNRNFTKAAFYVPALLDVLGSRQNGRQSGWPQLVESQNSPEEAKVAAALAPYYDGANFASRICCPVRMAVGFCDASCAPCAVYAGYNEIWTEKRILNGIGMTHACRREFYRVNEAWLAEPDEMRLKGAFPDDVKCVAVVSPASNLDLARLERGVKLLENAGYKVKVTPTSRQKGHLSAAERAKDLMDVWTDTEVDVVLAARGGLGGEQVLPLLDWEKMRSNPKWFVGFSNMTCLLNAMLAHGVSHPIAGPNLGSLERVTTLDSIVRLGQTVAGAALDSVWLRPVNTEAKRGTGCRGKPMGGHVLALSRKTPDLHFPDPTGRIVFLEIGGGGCSANDVRIWLGDLEKRGVFAKCVGAVLCDFLECGTPEETQAMLQGFADGVEAPVYAGYPFGHAPRSYAIDFEREAIISPAGELTFAPPFRGRSKRR